MARIGVWGGGLEKHSMKTVALLEAKRGRVLKLINHPLKQITKNSTFENQLVSLIRPWVINFMTHDFYSILMSEHMDPFLKRHRLVHHGRFPKSEARYCGLNMVSSTEISQNPSYKVQSPKSQNLEPIQNL